MGAKRRRRRRRKIYSISFLSRLNSKERGGGGVGFFISKDNIRTGSCGFSRKKKGGFLTTDRAGVTHGYCEYIYHSREKEESKYSPRTQIRKRRYFYGSVGNQRQKNHLNYEDRSIFIRMGQDHTLGLTVGCTHPKEKKKFIPHYNISQKEMRLLYRERSYQSYKLFKHLSRYNKLIRKIRRSVCN